MHDQNRKQLRIATIIFWVLLLYIVAALLWWLISLEQQNTVIHNLKKSQSVSGSAVQQNLKSLDNARRRNSIKHITAVIAKKDRPILLPTLHLRYESRVV